MKQVGSLEVEEDLAFQKKEWIFERFGWGALFLLIVATFIGLLGSGPVSTRQISAANGDIRVTYSTVVRRQSPEFLDIRFQGADRDKEVVISPALMQSWNIQDITPEPEAVILGDEGTAYKFKDEGAGLVRVEYQMDQSEIQLH